VKNLKVLIFFFISVVSLHASLDSKSAIFYYGDDIPYSLVGIHDYIVLKPEHVNTATHGFKLYKKNIYAYIDFKEYRYKTYSLKYKIEKLIGSGFENLYFDNIDIIDDNSLKNREKIKKDIVYIIDSVRSSFPKVKIIVNADFEIIDAIHKDIEAVVVKSLFKGVSKDGNYEIISQEKRNKLLSNIKSIKKFNLDIIDIEYIEGFNSKLIDLSINRIEKLDIIPYVCDKNHLRIGRSSKNALKRELLMLYDGTLYEGTDDDDKVFSSAFQHGATAVEYMGYIPVLYDISDGLISDEKLQRFAGAIIWLYGDYAKKHSKEFEKFIFKIKQNGMKILFFRGLDPSYHLNIFRKLRIGINTNFNAENISDEKKNIKYRSDLNYIGYEIDPYYEPTGFHFNPENSKKLLEVIGKDYTSTIAAITPWGGYVFEGASIVEISGETLWVIDPFKLIRDSLRLKKLAVPDPTTENGNRLLFVHMDGDGIMNRAEWDAELFSGDVLYKEIFSRYKIPQSISIIEGETAPYGLYGKYNSDKEEGDISPKLEAIARRTYTLDNIEPASHTFTHPFYWGKIINDTLNKNYRLQVPNYKFSLAREISGSLKYINTKLNFKKRKANTIFWSGDCLPTSTTLEYLYKNDILQINGGDTVIVNDKPWLSNIAPYGIKRGDYYQVFTGAQNENVFTNDWLGPFWGYKKVIQTFKLTDKPKRFKPIDIYYHTYSGSKRASLNALHTVYKWAMKQEVMPVYTSYYIPKVMDFYDISLAYEKNRWLIKGTKNLKTLRLEKDVNIDLSKSIGIIGMKDHESDRYIHLDEHATQMLVLSKEDKDQSYLIDSNVALISSNRSKKSMELLFGGEVPAKIRYRLAKGCELHTSPAADQIKRKSDIVSLSYSEKKDVHVFISCK
jgi:hypothetical protein